MVQASKKITEKRLQWYGHVRRMKEEHIVRRMLDVEIPGKRIRGRPCEENERGAHSEKNVRCGNIGEKKKRTAKPTWERSMQERHDKSGFERGQHDKQGSMEE